MCDCILGKAECAEAQILHEAANACYRIWQGDQTDKRWRDYKEAQGQYCAHIDKVEEAINGLPAL